MGSRICQKIFTFFVICVKMRLQRMGIKCLFCTLFVKKCVIVGME